MTTNNKFILKIKIKNLSNNNFKLKNKKVNYLPRDKKKRRTKKKLKAKNNKKI
jgi:hypothetical protein